MAPGVFAAGRVQLCAWDRKTKREVWRECQRVDAWTCEATRNEKWREISMEYTILVIYDDL